MRLRPPRPRPPPLRPSVGGDIALLSLAYDSIALIPVFRAPCHPRTSRTFLFQYEDDDSDRGEDAAGPSEDFAKGYIERCRSFQYPPWRSQRFYFPWRTRVPAALPGSLRRSIRPLPNPFPAS